MEEIRWTDKMYLDNQGNIRSSDGCPTDKPMVCGNNSKWCESCVSKGKCASTRPQGKTNADLFKQTFGIYATELWSMSESQFLEWLNSEYDCKEADNDT